MTLKLAFLFALAAANLHAWAEPAPVLENAERLSTAEITQAFSDVRDDAQVQDAPGNTAENYWFSDGSFVSNWSSADASGKVLGTWRVADNQRCIIIASGIPDRVGKEQCSPVYRRNTRYISVNADGSIHGIHTLSPIRAPMVTE